MGANKACNGDPLLVHGVKVLNIVVKEVVRAGETYAVFGTRFGRRKEGGVSIY